MGQPLQSTSDTADDFISSRVSSSRSQIISRCAGGGRRGRRCGGLGNWVVMVDSDAGQRGDHGVCDSRSVEGIRVTDWKKQPGYSGQRGDMRRTDCFDRDVGVGSWVARRDGMGIRGGLDGGISGTCWWFGARRGYRRGIRSR